MDTGDKKFYLNEGENPKIQSCLLHPDRTIERIVIVDATDKSNMFAGVTYGLCWYCDNMTGTEFLDDRIEKELKLRLTKLEGVTHE